MDEAHRSGAAVVPLHGRGLGVVATRELQFGDEVCVAPALVAGTDTVEATLRAILRTQLDSDSDSDSERLLRACWSFCPERAGDEQEERWAASRGAFESILADFGSGAATLAERGISTAHDLQLLALKLERNGFAEGVFPAACRFNHSCRPNCLFFTRPSSNSIELVVVAGETVLAGEELTIGYLPESRWHLPTDQRRTLLSRQYAFHCTCRRCHRPLQSQPVRHAERALEAMRCAQCSARESAHGEDSRSALTSLAGDRQGVDERGGAHEQGMAGAHVPLDEHEGPHGDRVGGYTRCLGCNHEGPEAHLDAVLVACHARVCAAARASAQAEDELEGLRQEQCALLELLAHEASELSCTHWLVAQMHWRLQATSGALLRQPVLEAAPREPGGAPPSDQLELRRLHALHSLGLVEALERIIPERSHLMAVVCSRAADALEMLAAAHASRQLVPELPPKVAVRPELMFARSSVSSRVAQTVCGAEPAMRLHAARLRDLATSVLRLVESI